MLKIAFFKHYFCSRFSMPPNLIMNKLYLITALTLLFFLFPTTSCKKNKKSFSPTLTIIQGSLQSSDNEELVFQGIVGYKINIDSNSRFLIQTSLSEAGIYKLISGFYTIDLYIEPGDHISADINFQNPADTKFDGDHAYENRFLQAFTAAKDNWQEIDFKTLYTLPETDFIKKIEERTQYLVDFQQTYQKEKAPFTEIFAEYLADEIAYDAAIQKMNYPFYYEYFKPDSVLKLSDTYDTFLQNIDIDDEQKLLTPSFRGFLTLYLDFITELDTTHSDKSKTYLKFSNISDKFTNKTIKEYLYYELLKNTLETSPNKVVDIMDDFLRLQTNDTYAAEINSMYILWKPLLQGNPAPEWKSKDKNGKEVSLESLKGNVVYIDVWASWCQPCIVEIPYMKDLQGKFEKENISFVSISIDQKEDAWFKTVKEKQLKGIQLIADKTWSEKILKDYNINGIPRFILIDKNGIIINVNAPRPSDKTLPQILTTALKM